MIVFFDKRKITAVLLLVIISSVGFYIQDDNPNHWLENPARYFSPTDNTPVTLTVDSYYDLNITQNMLNVNGIFEKLDQQRQAPNICLLGICLLFLGLQGKPFTMLPSNLKDRYTLSNDVIGTHFPDAGQLAGKQQDVAFAEFTRKVAENEWIFHRRQTHYPASTLRDSQQ